MAVDVAAARLGLGVVLSMMGVIPRVQHHLVGIQQAPRAVFSALLRQFIQAHQESAHAPHGHTVDTLILVGDRSVSDAVAI